jgi:diacylglycerol kinase (ATP)
MRVLTNMYQDCELLNLGFNKNGRGPYVLRQDGIPPDSLEELEDRFLLRKDGTWVLNITVYTLSEKEQEQFIFQDAAELYATVEKLYGKPVVEAELPPGKSRAELLAAINTTISKVWSRMREARATRSGATRSVMITPKYRCAVIFLNPASGMRNRESRLQVRNRLAGISDSLEEVITQPETALFDRTAESLRNGADLVVVAGGDGTVRQVASALVGTEATLGIVPLGTFNNFARSLNIPSDPLAACDLIQTGLTRTIDVGIANDREYFFEAAGVGVDADLFPIGEEVKGGRFHNILHAIHLALWHAQTSATLYFDRPLEEAYKRSFRGQFSLRVRRRRFKRRKRTIKIRCSFIAVGNGPFYGSNFAVCPGAILDDGLLSISVFRDFSKLELVWHFWSISRGRRQYHPKLEMFEGKTLEVSSSKPLSVHVDGQPIGRTPVRFRVLPKALKVVAG